MKKLMLVMPLMAISLLASCGGNNPTPEEIKFSATTSVTLDDTKTKANISLDWAPTEHSIECSNFTFTLKNQTDITSTVTPGEVGSRPLTLTVTFNSNLSTNDKGNLSFDYNDKTAKKEGKGKIENININIAGEEPSFSVTDSTVDYNDYTYSAVVELNWEPASDSITFSNLDFAYGEKHTENVTAEPKTSSPTNIYINFGEAGLTEDVTGTLSFNYTDTTTGVTGEDKIENITVDVDEPEPPVTKYSISMITEGTTISPETMDVGESYHGEITVTNDNKILDGGQSLKSVKLKTSEEDITSHCTEYDPSDDYKSATFTIPAEYITDDIEVEVTLKDKPAGTGTVIWYDENGVDVLDTDTDVPVGDYPTYDGKTPYKAKDATNAYRFSAWDPAIHPVTEKTEDNEYKAVYTAVPLTYLKANMRIVIPEASSELIFSFVENGIKEITVDWGDEIVNSNASHTYDQSGAYDISIYGEDITSIDAGSGRAYLTELQLQEGITAINDFANCANLTSVSIPSSIVSVKDNAFTNCNNLAYEVYDECKYLGNNNNKYQVIIGPCEKTITETSIHESCTVIKDYAFDASNGLASITIPNSVISISKGAFKSCWSVASITIPNSVISIGESAFYNCFELESVDFNELPNLENIESGAFASCKGLKSVVIPASVKSIGRLAFTHVDELQVVDLSGFDVQDYKELPLLSSSAFTNYPDNVVFYVKNVYMLGLFMLDDVNGWDQIDDSLFKVKTTNNL